MLKQTKKKTTAIQAQDFIFDQNEIRLTFLSFRLRKNFIFQKKLWQYKISHCNPRKDL